jgi:AhpD family alkylhydroperoxidase
MKTTIRTLTLAAVTLLSASALADSAEARAAQAEMKQTFGVVPTPFRLVPEDGVAPLWDEFKGLELNPNTALNGKQKELIGLAVAAQIPCQYCTYMHTEAAKLNGAGVNETREAIAVAGVVRHWATLADGQLDDAPAAKDARPAPLPPEVEATYKDVEKTIGSVPPFIRSSPSRRSPRRGRATRRRCSAAATACRRRSAR